MIAGLFTTILALIQAIPAITGGVNNFVNKYYDSKVLLTQARVGGDVEVARALVSGVVDEKKVTVSFLSTIASSPALIFFMGLFVVPTGVWYTMCIFNIVTGIGSTDPLRGQVATIANIVVGGLFGVGGVAGIGAAFSQWRKS